MSYYVDMAVNTPTCSLRELSSPMRLQAAGEEKEFDFGNTLGRRGQVRGSEYEASLEERGQVRGD